ncbi:type III polyketide synthase [Sphingomonas hankyongi]|uniref:Type III polyketide synthase n=1 Tax=Sphingomonas hankyongi TaxID=2908209 RepID=A0ABT0S266_9SPHN|nr:type III polyketide synthase [Sphingomonas hankyongi]MCL6729650.1 type III polyketide synthase [Sphingomonas hankyongi]
MQVCSLLSLATAVPPNVIQQPQAKATAREAFGRKALFDRLSGVFDNAGIAKRHIVAPHDWYTGNHGWHDRNNLYLEAAEQLFMAAASAAIEKAGLKPDEIDGIVTVSTTGIATPSLEARTGPRLGLRSDVRRVPVFGLGCAGGVSGLAAAARMASAEPGTNWLFVTVETCSISIRLDSDDPAAVVATALFGDGAAAAVVSSGEHSLARIVGSAEKLWPDTQRIMGWDVEDPGLAVVFDRAIPPFIEAELAQAVDDMCAGLGTSRDEIDRFCCHPGGVKVIDAIETALELPQGELNIEREVLNDYGNMSAPTVMFVLERLLERGLPNRVMMTAFGPGFTCAGLLLEAA